MPLAPGGFPNVYLFRLVVGVFPVASNLSPSQLSATSCLLCLLYPSFAVWNRLPCPQRLVLFHPTLHIFKAALDRQSLLSAPGSSRVLPLIDLHCGSGLGALPFIPPTSTRSNRRSRRRSEICGLPRELGHQYTCRTAFYSASGASAICTSPQKLQSTRFLALELILCACIDRADA